MKIGADLQSWGVPNVVALDKDARLKYARLYRLGGTPTDLGMAFHEVLAPLVAKDPAILGRISKMAFEQAAQELARGLEYRKDPTSDDMQKVMRLGNLMDVGHDYPEWRAAFSERARKALSAEPQPGAQPAGFGLR